jgi:hypothetical protein
MIYEIYEEGNEWKKRPHRIQIRHSTDKKFLMKLIKSQTSEILNPSAEMKQALTNNNLTKDEKIKIVNKEIERLSRLDVDKIFVDINRIILSDPRIQTVEEEIKPENIQINKEAFKQEIAGDMNILNNVYNRVKRQPVSSKKTLTDNFEDIKKEMEKKKK